MKIAPDGLTRDDFLRSPKLCFLVSVEDPQSNEERAISLHESNAFVGLSPFIDKNQGTVRFYWDTVDKSPPSIFSIL
jgi:hypothetical protein